jgi:tetratricopeptide (TPR) repeat protein
LALHLLGCFAVHAGDYPIPETTWRRSAAAKLVKLLPLAPGYRLHRDQVVEILWPNLERRAGARNLYRALERQLGQPSRIGRVLDHLAQTACAAGADDEALRLTDEALELRRVLGDEPGSARALCNRGIALLHLDDLGGAERALAESLRLRRRLGDALGVAMSTIWLGSSSYRRRSAATE